MRTKKLLVIAAIAVMLAAATSAYAYHESWNGWWYSGTLTYNGHDYTAVDSGYVSDSTFSTFSDTTDTFYLPQDVIVNFIYVVGEIEDTIEFEDTVFTGSKPTGESGTKEVHDGEWSGTAILYDRYQQPIQTFTVWGTWDTSDGGNCFNYLPGKLPNYSAHWYVGGSSPAGLGGKGGSAGELLPE